MNTNPEPNDADLRREIVEIAKAAARRRAKAEEQVRAFVALDKADLAAWCARRRRRDALRRTILAACLVVGCCALYANAYANPTYYDFDTTSGAKPQVVCDDIINTLHSL